MRLGAAAALALFPAALSGSGAEARWVGAWGTAPSIAGPVYADQTTRLVVHTSRGASRLRLRLSNRFGDARLTVDRVTVGRRRAGASVDPGFCARSGSAAPAASRSRAARTWSPIRSGFASARSPTSR